jgi:hypothetical protein
MVSEFLRDSLFGRGREGYNKTSREPASGPGAGCKASRRQPPPRGRVGSGRRSRETVLLCRRCLSECVWGLVPTAGDAAGQLVRRVDGRGGERGRQVRLLPASHTGDFRHSGFLWIGK